MAKLVTDDLVSLTNQTTAIANINSNFAATEVAMEKTLSRDGTTPNEMEASLDMNSNTIINLPDPLTPQEPATKSYVDDALVDAVLGTLDLSTSTVITTGGTESRTLADRFADVTHAADHGILPSTAAATNTTLLNALISTLSAAGGGDIVFNEGTYNFAGSGVVIMTGVHLWGKGKNVTILKSTNNTDVIRTANFYTQYTAGTISVSDTNHFGLHCLTLDGDASNKVFSADNLNGLALWGYKYAIESVHIQNVKGHHYRAHWGAFGEFGMKSTIRDLSLDTCGQHGIWFTGPHDSEFSHVTIIDAGQQTNATYDGVFVDTGGTARWYNIHPWHRSTVTNRVRYSLNIGSGGNEFFNGRYEGNGRIRVAGQRNILDGFSVYAPQSDLAMILVDGDQHILNGRVFTNTANPNPVVLEIGPTTAASECIINLVVNVSSTGTTNEIVKFTNDEGNTINIRSVGCNNAVAYTGTPDADTRGLLNQSFPKFFEINWADVGTAFAASNGANNNCAIPASNLVRITGSSGAFSLTGLTKGDAGRKITLYNTTAQDMTLVNESGSSDAANRIVTLTGADVVLTGTSMIDLHYDITTARWLVDNAGDVIGPTSVTSGHAAVYSGTTGKLISSAGAAPYIVGGTDVAVADGGTGASTAALAARNLGFGLPFVNFTAVPLTGSTSETVLGTITIPAGQLGIKGAVQLTAFFSNNNSGNNKTMRVRLGGLAGTLFASGVNTTNIQTMFNQVIGAANSASAQVGNTIIGDDGWGAAAGAHATAAIDTTAAVDLVLTGQLANSGDTLTLLGYIAVVYYVA